MKKLFLIFAISLFANACSNNRTGEELKIKHFADNEKKDKTSQDNGESDTGSDSLKKISSKESKSHIGDSVIVKGYIADIYSGEKVAYLNFENRFPKNVLSCAVFSGKMNEFGELSRYKNKNVEVTGRITSYKNKPQIILNSPDQIRIIE